MGAKKRECGRIFLPTLHTKRPSSIIFDTAKAPSSPSVCGDPISSRRFTNAPQQLHSNVRSRCFLKPRLQLGSTPSENRYIHACRICVRVLSDIRQAIHFRIKSFSLRSHLRAIFSLCFGGWQLLLLFRSLANGCLLLRGADAYGSRSAILRANFCVSPLVISVEKA